MSNLSSLERVKLSLNHREPDRIPFDLGATVNSGISVNAYKNLLDYLGIRNKEPQARSTLFSVAEVDEEILERFKVDFRGLITNPPSNWQLNITEDKEYSYATDEWGIKYRKPKKKGFWYDFFKFPLSGEITRETIDRYPWPDPSDPARVKNLKQKAKMAEKKKKALVIDGWYDAFFEMSFLLRGFENFFMDLAINPSLACYLMDKIIELKMRFWELVLEDLGDYITVVALADDLGDQRGPRISLDMYRKYVKPRQKKLFNFIKKTAPKPVYIFLHSCGSVYDFIPDLIEVGVDILNPVQVSAAKMDTRKLKKEFGRDIVFWGGGVDTQYVLPRGTPQEVKDEVKRRIDDLAPGGGFVFNAVHNIQEEVPPQNIIAMWEALQEYGKY